ncbi:hypothetical protein NIES37_50880 [Tolypothrix tenuis PCC 7101]|uniref:Uncharacterized protein n=1 Tax=Tolypothrix tenuis PCC 7101 TaxID=231146 RepID=A0A1Z4N5T8_9CYAN|nr:hypothetical protein NIES37_50880 [Tolypothrix tenuis PCC 7101]BAZ74988.1 hypothetical protein NIES50_35680 [Aulosira laxa NIES-50]
MCSLIINAIFAVKGFILVRFMNVPTTNVSFFLHNRFLLSALILMEHTGIDFQPAFHREVMP